MNILSRQGEGQELMNYKSNTVVPEQQGALPEQQRVVPEQQRVVPEQQRANQYLQARNQIVPSAYNYLSYSALIPTKLKLAISNHKLSNEKLLNFKKKQLNQFQTEYYHGIEYNDQKFCQGTCLTITERNYTIKYEYYEGEFAQNYYHGYGTLIIFLSELKLGKVIDEIQSYQGEFFKGEIKSKYFEKINDIEKKQNKDQPRPIIYLKDKEERKYYGALKDGSRDGWGIFEWPNKQRFVGEFKDDFFHGLGRITFPNKNSYEGEWKEGKMDGFGEYIWVRETEFRKDLKEKFIGIYKEGKKVTGIYEWIDQVKYCGGFQNDLMDDYALLIQKHGKSILTQWDKGIKIGEVKEDQEEEINTDSQGSNQQMPFMGKQGS